MITLIQRLRRMTSAGTAAYSVAETGGARSYFSDADLEGILHERESARLNQALVEITATMEQVGESTGSKLVYRNGHVKFPGTLDTETATLVTFWGGPLEGKSTILPNGRIEWEDSQLGKEPLLTGTCYDLNGAAADILTDWASAVKMGFDISVDSQKLSRSQRHKQMLEQAEYYRKHSVIGSIQTIRSDVRPGNADRPFTKGIEKSFADWGLYPASSK